MSQILQCTIIYSLFLLFLAPTLLCKPDFAVEIKLTGGRTPFEGLVEVRKAGSQDWKYVCKSEHRGWNLLAARTICKQLGMVTVMWHNSIFSSTNSKQGICDMTCDPSVEVLEECSIDWGSDGEGCPCSHEGHAGLTCYFPGYLGRFKEHDTNRIFPFEERIFKGNESTNSIHSCLSVCRNNSVAVIESSDECYCSDWNTNYTRYGEVLPDQKTVVHDKYGIVYDQQQCPGNRSQACGGHYQLDVYDSRIGACGGILTNSTGFVYSPNFPDTYSNNENCSWTINANHRIRVKIWMVRIGADDQLIINYGLSGERNLTKNDEGQWFDNHDNFSNLIVKFTSKESTNSYGGFALEYFSWPIHCGDPVKYEHAYSKGVNDTFGDEVTYHCNTGASNTLDRDAVSYCTAHGKWLGGNPLCKDYTILFAAYGLSIGIALLMVIVLSALICKGIRANRKRAEYDQMRQRIVDEPNTEMQQNEETVETAFSNPAYTDSSIDNNTSNDEHKLSAETKVEKPVENDNTGGFEDNADYIMDYETLGAPNKDTQNMNVDGGIRKNTALSFENITCESYKEDGRSSALVSGNTGGVADNEDYIMDYETLGAPKKDTQNVNVDGGARKNTALSFENITCESDKGERSSAFVSDNDRQNDDACTENKNGDVDGLYAQVIKKKDRRSGTSGSKEGGEKQQDGLNDAMVDNSKSAEDSTIPKTNSTPPENDVDNPYAQVDMSKKRSRRKEKEGFVDNCLYESAKELNIPPDGSADESHSTYM
ncbi:uncharacterized protein LOC144445693 [Glandiceps talaboti]